MPTSYTETLESLVADAKAAEQLADLVRRFVENGGAHRISISIDHPDAHVKSEIERLVNAMPTGKIAEAMVKQTERNVSKAFNSIRSHVNSGAVSLAPGEHLRVAS